MAKTTNTTQEETPPLCSDCLTKTEKKKVFSKEVYKCPKCKRSFSIDTYSS